MVQRWTLYDPILDDAYVFPVNPNKMTSPHAPRSLAILTTAPSVGRVLSQGRVIEANQDPYEWSFNGFIRTQAHHDALLAWSKKVTKLILTDHLNRDWSIRITQFVPEEVKPTFRAPWRFNYEMKVLMYGPVT